MAINKRFAHLNHSGSNHSILDAESAYITGTLQVGPAVPALGSDVNFFVSGAKDGEGGLVPAVGVFGGDLVVSGNLHFLGGITGSIPGVEAYWSSPSLGVIKAETSSSLVEVPFLSASNGAEITGSVNINVTGPSGPIGLIISASSNSAVRAFEISDDNALPGQRTIFYIDPQAAQLEFMAPAYVNNSIELNAVQSPGVGNLHINVDNGGGPNANTGSIAVADENSNFATLNLQIGELQINGQGGQAGYVLTSSGPGVAPGWAAQPAGASEYWFSTGSNEIYTTGSVLLRAGLAASPARNLIEFDVSGSEYPDNVGSLNNGSFIKVTDVSDAASNWTPYSGSLYIMATNVGSSGSGGFIDIQGGNAGWDDINKTGGGDVRLTAGMGAPTNLASGGSGGTIGISAGSPGWTGGFAGFGEAGESGNVIIAGGDVVYSAVSRSLAGSKLLIGGLGTGFKTVTINDDAGGGLGVVDYASDIFFFTSGSIGAKDTLDRGVAVFAGDTVISGVLYTENDVIHAGAGGINVGSDTLFFVSGAVNDQSNKSVFGGQVYVSGNIEIPFERGIRSRNSASNAFTDLISLRDATASGGGENLVAVGDPGGSGNDGIAFLQRTAPYVVALITGSNAGYFSGSYSFPQGITGSITKLTDGNDYLIAGTGIQLTTQSNGAITIDATGGVDPVYWNSFVNGVIKAQATSSMVEVPYLSSSNGAEVSGSAIFAGAGGVVVGSDTVFFVSGNTSTNSPNKAVFGGTTFVSGNLQLAFESKLQSRNSASNDFASLIQLVDGSPTYGNNFILLGDDNRTSGFAFQEAGTPGLVALITGSNAGYFSGSYSFPQGITASHAVVSPAGTGRGLLKFGGLDIGPITGSVTLINPNPGDWILSGSILSASFGVWDGTNAAVVRHEFHILGIGTDSGGGVQTFAATYLVMSNISTTGVQTVALGGVTELSRETSGSYAAAWDVNVTADCLIEVSASIDAGNVQWYAQRVKEMSLNTGGSRT